MISSSSKMAWSVQSHFSRSNSKAERNVQPAVVFAVDISGSMTTEEIERVSNVMRAFSNWLAERPSSFAVIAFAMKVKVLQPFGNDPRKLDQAFNRLLNEPNG